MGKVSVKKHWPTFKKVEDTKLIPLVCIRVSDVINVSSQLAPLPGQTTLQCTDPYKATNVKQHKVYRQAKDPSAWDPETSPASICSSRFSKHPTTGLLGFSRAPFVLLRGVTQ